jgi:hypothetical protein
MSDSKPPSDNPFLQIPVLLKDAVGRMPAPLIIILAVSSSVAVLVGVLLHVVTQKQDVAFLPTRLEVNHDAAIDEQSLAGFWAYQDKNIDMTLQMRDGGFEWLMASPLNPYTRYYTRGSYRVEGDVLILQQREDFGVPIDLQRLDVEYLPSTLQSINMRLSREENKMVWDIEETEARLLPMQLKVLPQFRERIVWTKLSDLTPSIR